MDKILVVDDEPEIVEVLRDFLTQKRFEVIGADCGSKASDILNSDSAIKLMILDMKMPGKSGMEVLEELSQLDSDKKIPVIILTGSIDAEKYRDKLKEAGYSYADIAIKPIDLNVILGKIKEKLK